MPGGPFASLPAGCRCSARSRAASLGCGRRRSAEHDSAGRARDVSLAPNAVLYGRYALEKSDFFVGSNTNSLAGFDTGATEENHNFLASLTNVWSSRFTTQSKVTFNRLHETQPLGEQPASPTLYMRTVPTALRGVPIALPGYLPFNPGAAIPFGGPQNFLQLDQDATWLSWRPRAPFRGHVRLHPRQPRVRRVHELGADPGHHNRRRARQPDARPARAVPGRSRSAGRLPR